MGEIFGWQNNFGEFKPSLYSYISDATSNWRVKFWRIRSELLNLPKFYPAKVSLFMVHASVIHASGGGLMKVCALLEYSSCEREKDYGFRD